MIGVLGGMGPAATVDFMSKVIRLTPVERDQDHVPLVVVSDGRVPDRVGPILAGRGCSPLPAMVGGIRALEAAGATCIVIPCHTAHAWLGELQASTRLPIIGIVDAVMAALERRAAPGTAIGMLATVATLRADLYQSRLEAAGHRCLIPDGGIMERLVLPAIARVKRDRAGEAAPLLRQAVEQMREDGAAIVLLACTELPVALAAMADPPADVLDATEALARACIDWYRAQAAAH